MPILDDLLPEITPGDDFFSYVNNKWIQANPIPDDKGRVGVFTTLTDSNNDKLRALLEAPAAEDDPKGATLAKAFYQSAMDEARIVATTPQTVAVVLEGIAALDSAAAVRDYITATHAKGQALVWCPYIEPNDKDSTRYQLRFSQDGLGLPERDYYLEETEQFKTVREHYQIFLTSLFELLKLDDAGMRAGRVIALETELAKLSMSAVERRDPEKTYNLFDQTALAETFTGLDWSAYVTALGFKPDREINISQPNFMLGALGLIETQPLETWLDYLRFHRIVILMTKLDAAFVDLHFSFYRKVLSGAQAQEPRWRRMVNLSATMLPEPIGQLFVKDYFDDQAKAAINELVEHLKIALQKRIEQLDWMSEETKAKALHKLGTFLPLLGYPDEWKSYAELQLSDSFADNFEKIVAHEWKREVARIDLPVDRREWLMSPAQVNAYYWPNTNGITFPAGILQPPFFDASDDFALNYGAIGGVIGHEMTHGFDDQGSQFDADGNLKSWWTEDDRKTFEARAAKLVEQFNSYTVGENQVNGELTLGENIADLGGVLVAFDGMQAKLAELGKRDEVDGLTPEQRFFLGYARTWRGAVRPELALQFLVSDPHAPGEYRVNGIVRNIDAFYDAFDVQPDNTLYLSPEDRVRIW